MIDTLRSCAETLFFCLERAVTAALYPWCLLRRRLGARPRIPILMYHQVGRPVEGVPACADCVSPHRFERQIRAILDAGYEVIPLSSLVRALRDGRTPLPGRSVVLTFDDGFRGQFVNAYPILRRHRLPATLFVVPGYVGRYSFYRHLGLEDAPAARDIGEQHRQQQREREDHDARARDRVRVIDGARDRARVIDGARDRRERRRDRR